MKKILLIFALGIFLINLVSAVIICIDHTPPSAPSNLILTQSGNNIQLTWTPATDQPSCSGISHYDIYKNSAFLTSVDETNYLDIGLPDGTYTYTIYAFDLVGHNEGVGILGTIILGTTTNNGGSSGGGGGGSGLSSYWQCGEWSECIDGTQTRICENIGRNLPNRTETKSCSVDFTPLSYETKESEKETTELTEDNQGPKSAFSKITGAVTGTLGTGGTIGVSVFILMIIGAFVFIKLKRK